MLLVKTYLAPSSIHGMGLYAAEDIEEGAVIWRHDPVFDIGFKKEQLDALSELQKKSIKNYLFYVKPQDLYVLCADDARFINHSENPCMTNGENKDESVATRHIVKGEELTDDYRNYDSRSPLDLIISDGLYAPYIRKRKLPARLVVGFLRMTMNLFKGSSNK